MPRHVNALEDVLRERAPDILNSLRQGLPEGEVRRLLERFEYDVPDELIAMYAWHDGSEFVNDQDRAELFPGAQMLPLADALEKMIEGRKADQAHDPPGWQPGWLPIFVGYQWKYWAADCARPGVPVVTFDWLDLPETWLAHRTFDLMLETITRCWRIGAYRVGRNATVIENRKAVAAINRELDTEPVDIDRLVADLGSTDNPTHSHAIGMLRTRLYPEAVPALIAMLDTDSPGRIAAVELLGEIGDSAALAKLRSVADDYPDKLLRDYARHTLAERTEE
jgi:hypothetical protein